MRHHHLVHARPSLHDGWAGCCSHTELLCALSLGGRLKLVGSAVFMALHRMHACEPQPSFAVSRWAAKQRAHLVDAAPETRGLNYYFGAKGHDEKQTEMQSASRRNPSWLPPLSVARHQRRAALVLCKLSNVLCYERVRPVGLAQRLEANPTEVTKAEWVKHVPEVDFVNA